MELPFNTSPLFRDIISIVITFGINIDIIAISREQVSYYDKI